MTACDVAISRLGLLVRLAVFAFLTVFLTGWVAIAGAELQLAKTVCAEPPCPGLDSVTLDEGADAVFCYTVENTGDVAALNVSVVDDNATSGTGADDFSVELTGLTDEDDDGQSDDLAPGASATGITGKTMTTPGTFVNTATAHAIDATTEDEVWATDTATVIVNDLVAELAVTKTVCTAPPCPGSDSVTIDEGDDVVFCYTVENTGDAAVANVGLFDDNATPGIGPDDFSVELTGLTDEDDDGQSDDLAPGASATGITGKTMTTPGTFVNTATAHGIDVTSSDDVTATDTAIVIVNDLVAELAVTKTACAAPPCPGSESVTIDEGDDVVFCYTVENTGDAAVANVCLFDDNATPGIGPDDFSVELTGLTDEDDDGQSDDLAPGASATGITGKTMATPGTFVNTATAHGIDVTSSDDVTATDTATVVVNDRVAELSVAKTVCTAPPCPGSESLTVDEGDLAQFCYTVENTGDAAALNVSVVDDNATPGNGADDWNVWLGGLSDADNDGQEDDLEPGGSAWGAIGRTMMTPGTLVNTATAHATDATDGSEVWDTDTATVTVNDRVAELLVTKTVCAAPPCPGSESLTIDEGDLAQFCYTVENTGDAAALDVSVVDDNATPGNGADDWNVWLGGLSDADNDGQEDDLEPGGSAWGAIGRTMMTPGTFVNTATAHAIDMTDGSNVSASDTATVNVTDLCAALAVTKTADPTTVSEGGTVTYSYTVTNAGTAAAADVVVWDDNATPGSGGDDTTIVLTGLTDEDDDGTADDLAVGASASGTLVVTLSVPGTVTNTAHAAAYDTTGEGIVSASDNATVTVTDRCAALSMTKTASPTTVDEGGTVTYTYTITNVGTAAAANVVVFDDNATPGSTGDDISITLTGLTDEDHDAIADDLAVGASASGTHTVTLSVPGTVTNTADAAAYDTTGDGMVTATDDATVTVNDRRAELSITKTATPTTVDEGGTVTYTYTVTNVGTAAAVNVVVFDDNATPGSTGDDFTVALIGLTDEDHDAIANDLAVGASASGTHTVTLSVPGMITNTADAAAYDTTGDGMVTASDDATVVVNDLVAELHIVKTVCREGEACPGSDTLTVNEGDTLTYCYEIMNTGTAAAVGILAKDDHGTPADAGDDVPLVFVGLTDEDGDTFADDLAPGKSATATYSTTLRTPGEVINTAAAQATDITSGDVVEASDTAAVEIVNVPPTLHDCPGNIDVDNDRGLPSAVVSWTPPTATDPSGTPPTITSTHQPGDTFPVGMTTVTYTATDDHGAQDTCTFDVTVTNTEPPIVDILVPAEDAVYHVGEEIPAQWTATSIAGLRTVRATADPGHLLDTSRPGTFQFTVTATDVTGLTTVAATSWRTIFFMRPPADGAPWTDQW